MSSATKIMITALLSLGFVLGLITLLNYFKFESSLAALTDRRLAVIADNTQDSIEAAVNLGLNLQNLESAPAVLQRARAQDGRIEALHVFGADGRILYSTGTGAVGDAIDPAWLSAARQTGARSWRVSTDTALVTGRRLDSSFAQGIGGLALVYPVADGAMRVAAMRDDLIGAALLILLAFTLLGAVGTTLALRHVGRLFSGLTHAVEDTGSGASGSRIPPSLQAVAASLQTNLAQARDQLDDMEAILAAAGGPDRRPATGDAGAHGPVVRGVGAGE
ncbi:hypothetical protein [Arenibaculum sp.]|jgi:hypothetical protein|uniref:hypothetical protein n=1 Tax=Arenibaculum sp. TaxID=2865862 RepID=UPI002E1499FA|nr:hypothetical protein [Arenibaculum sp.]